MQRLLLFLLLALPLAGCDYCRQSLCDPATPYASFRLVDAATGADLLFGTGARYRPHDLKAFAYQDTDSVSVPLEAHFESAVGDSVIGVDCIRQPKIIYLQLSATDIDTIAVGYVFRKTGRCSCASEMVDSLRYNAVPGEPLKSAAFKLTKN